MAGKWMRVISLGALLLTFGVGANAQHKAGALAAPPRISFPIRSASPGFHGSITGGEFRHSHAGHPNFIYGGSPLWWDEPYQSSSVPSQIILMPPQAGASEAARPISYAASQDPLVIELRGDQYVRLSAAAGETTGVAASPSRIVSSSDAPAGMQSHASSNLPTIFVFRDGHREESSDYSIYDGVIHARSDLYTDGAWTKQIPLSALNIAESKEANEVRGVRFVLPAGPNEVVTRP